MELLWNELNAQRLIYRGTVQQEASGTIPVPAGRQISEVLDYSAEVLIDSCKADENRIESAGRIKASVLCSDAQGELFCFDSESDFTQCIEAENVQPGMNAAAKAAVKTFSVQKVSADTLSFSLTADINCRVTSGSSLKLLKGIQGMDDMEMKTKALKATRRVEIGSGLVRICEELTGEGADYVLEHSAKISVRDTAIENGNACVSGTINLDLLVQTADGELMQISRNIPFRENIALNAEADEIYAAAELKDTNIRALGTEFSLIAFDADVLFKIYGIKSSELNIPLDAYSPSLNFNCLMENLRIADALGGNCMQQSLRENISVPEGMANIFSSVFSAARPVITSVSFSNGEMNAEGLLMTRLIYKSGDGRIHSFIEEVPFEISMSAPEKAEYANLDVSVSAGVTGGGGTAAQISYSIDARAEFFGETQLNAVAGIAECEPEAVPAGIIVYNIRAGESVFDIGKKFRIPLKKVRSLNKNADINADDSFKEGDKILLFI